MHISHFPQPPSSFLLSLSALALLALALITACTPSGARQKTPTISSGGQEVAAGSSALPRANPGYVQWLERQSMLRTAALFTSQVSGTERLLLAPSVDTSSKNRKQGSEDRIDTLLAAADSWLWVHTPSLLTVRLRSTWEELSDAAFSAQVAALGLKGMYIAPTAESGSIWEYDRKSSPSGEDSTSLEFAPHMGGEKGFEQWMVMATGRQWQTGLDILPAATGLGPDFFLAARGVRDFPGLYMMLEVPDTLKDKLPIAKQAWEGAVLKAQHIALLEEAGLLPPALSRDHLPFATKGGWAVTGPVLGSDGHMRRWVYRYHQEPGQSPLHWDDPSGHARKVLSASIIRQVGLRTQTLVGLRLEALVGLDAAKADAGAATTLEPATSALRDLGREVRRYGGWSVHMDPLPAALIPSLLQGGADFLYDSITTPLAEEALHTGDARPLLTAMQASLDANVDQRRLLRVITGLQGPGVLIRQPSKTTEKNTSTLLEARHKALALFRAGLPGLLFISGQDITGLLPSPVTEGTDSTQKAKSMTPRGAWSFLPESMVPPTTRQGMPKAPSHYAPLQDQWNDKGSFANTIRTLTTARQKYAIARASIAQMARTSSEGSIGLWLQLPDNSLMLMLGNFSPTPITENVTLPRAGQLLDILQEKALGRAQGSIPIRLEGYEIRWLRIS